MKDTHDILKQNRVPDDCQLESNQSYANEIERGLQMVLNPTNRTLKQTLEVYDQSLGDIPSFHSLKEGLLSQQESGRHRSLCAYIDLEKANPEMQ